MENGVYDELSAGAGFSFCGVTFGQPLVQNWELRLAECLVSRPRLTVHVLPALVGKHITMQGRERKGGGRGRKGETDRQTDRLTHRETETDRHREADRHRNRDRQRETD